MSRPGRVNMLDRRRGTLNCEQRFQAQEPAPAPSNNLQKPSRALAAFRGVPLTSRVTHCLQNQIVAETQARRRRLHIKFLPLPRLARSSCLRTSSDTSLPAIVTVARQASHRSPPPRVRWKHPRGRCHTSLEICCIAPAIPPSAFCPSLDTSDTPPSDRLNPLWPALPVFTMMISIL